MKLPGFLKLRYSALILTLIGAVACFVSYQLGVLGDNSLSDRAGQIYAFLLTAAAPTAWAVMASTINSEVHDLAEKVQERLKIENQKTLDRLTRQYSINFQGLREELEPFLSSSERYQECIEALDKWQLEIQKFEEKEKAAGQISNWLSLKRNREALKKYAVDSVLQIQEQIPAKTLQEFRNDIGRCINWLRHSIDRLLEYEVDKSLLISASTSLPGRLSPYIIALNAIKTHKILKELSGDSDVLKDFVDELIRQISD